MQDHTKKTRKGTAMNKPIAPCEARQIMLRKLNKNQVDNLYNSGDITHSEFVWWNHVWLTRVFRYGVYAFHPCSCDECKKLIRESLER